MKKRYLSLLLLGVGALSLSSCGYGEISLEEFKTQLTANSKKEAPGFTSGTIKSEIKNYKFECSNTDLGKIIEGTMSAALKVSLAAAGFNIDKNYDLSKGFSESRNLSNEEFKSATSIRYSGETIVEEIETSAKFYKSGDSLKISQKEEDEGEKMETSLYFDEYGYATGKESSILMESKKGEDSFKISLYASSFISFSK